MQALPGAFTPPQAGRRGLLGDLGLPAPPSSPSLPRLSSDSNKLFLTPWSLQLTRLRLICLHGRSCEVAFQGLPQAWEAVCHLVNIILEIFLQHHGVAGLHMWVA